MVTAALVVLTAKLEYKEDIADFLPLDREQQEAFVEQQQAAGARRIYAVVSIVNCQLSTVNCQPAVERFCEMVEQADTAGVLDVRTADAPEAMLEAMDAIYARMPYLLTADDYARMDSMTAEADFVARQLDQDKQLLMLPTAGMMAMQVSRDPLGLFAPVVQRYATAMGGGATAKSVVMVDSPYGASETEHNAALVAMLQQVCDSVGNAYPDVSIHLTGGPVIAVGNAQQIKRDSMTAVTIAAVLILLLLWLAFRNVRNMVLIAVSIAWGWLAAMGCLALVHSEVSVIVIGIASVIVGIAVNYPLHLIAHLSHTTDVRTALKEIRMPLVVGNITTVGAFLALVPLQSVALRDLGLFSAFLLVGTIVFVLVWLPHLVHSSQFLDLKVKATKVDDIVHNSLFESVAVKSKFKVQSWFVWTAVVLTVVLGWFSLQTSFDADLRNINYMTDEQRQDMQLLEHPSMVNVQWSMVNGQWSMVNGQWSMVNQWNEWRTTKGTALCQQLREKATAMGFANDSFDDFYKLIALSPRNATLSKREQPSDITSAIVSSLTDNFNYIGWACGAIVFFFLWFSMGSIELALISFLPMAVSWVWILGIMALLGIQFNVVNIILATFIFGQGDDYTIFMTEGCQYEYAYRRKMLGAYRHSIIISALVMLIGIGALITSRHPALRSLAEVTIVGMFVVVLMAWLVPPLIFRWMVYDRNGHERRRPITLRNMLWRRSEGSSTSLRTSAFRLVAERYRYRGVEISMAVNRRLRYWRSHEAELTQLSDGETITDDGWGETALLVALLNPQRRYVAVIADDERALVARHAYENVTDNLKHET